MIRKIHYVGTRLSKVSGSRRGPSIWVVTDKGGYRSDKGGNRSDKGGYCQGRYVMMWGCGVDDFYVMLSFFLCLF